MSIKTTRMLLFWLSSLAVMAGVIGWMNSTAEREARHGVLVRVEHVLGRFRDVTAAQRLSHLQELVVTGNFLARVQEIEEYVWVLASQSAAADAVEHAERRAKEFLEKALAAEADLDSLAIAGATGEVLLRVSRDVDPASSAAVVLPISGESFSYGIEPLQAEIRLDLAGNSSAALRYRFTLTSALRPHGAEAATPFHLLLQSWLRPMPRDDVLTPFGPISTYTLRADGAYILRDRDQAIQGGAYRVVPGSLPWTEVLATAQPDPQPLDLSGLPSLQLAKTPEQGWVVLACTPRAGPGTLSRCDALPVAAVRAAIDTERLKLLQDDVLPMILVILLGAGVGIGLSRRQARRERALAEQLRLATRAGGAGIWELDLRSRRVQMNPRMWEMRGLTPSADGFGDLGFFYELVDPDDRGKLDLDNFKPGATFDLVYRIHRADGELRYLHSRGGSDPDGAVIRGTEFDVTEQELAREAEANSRRVLQAVADAAPVTIALLGPDFKYRFVNQAYAVSVDRPAGEIIGKHAVEVLGEKYFGAVRGSMQDALSGTQREFEIEYSAAGRPPAVWLMRYAPFAGASGRPDGLVAAGLDVTERTLAARALRQSEALFRSVLEAVPSGKILVDAAGRILLVNAQIEHDTLYSREELIGQPVEVLVPAAKRDQHPGLRAGFAQAPRRLSIGRAGDVHAARKDGSEFPAEIIVTPMDLDGGPATLVSIVDITSRTELESQLRELQKMEAIGQLTGGLAHDFNNLLGIVIGGLDMVIESLADDSPMRRWAGNALDAALRGADVTRSLLAVARRQPLRTQSLDLNPLIVEMLPLMQSSAGAAITLVPELAEAPVTTRIDPAGLSNVLLNLVINARDAMKEQGGDRRIWIRTRTEHLPADAFGKLAEGSYAVIEVEDNGPGMNPEVMSRAFEPFFTTKERGRGTGLGLSMTLGFAEQLNGTARIRSAPGEGTTMSLYFPAG